MNCSIKSYSGLGVTATDRDDVFSAGPSEDEQTLTTTDTSGRSTTPTTPTLETTTPSSNYVIRFKQRVFSFPDTPPDTPTKSTSGSSFTDLKIHKIHNTRIASQRHETVLNLREYDQVLRSEERSAQGNALGISGLDKEDHSFICVPSTPKLDPPFKFVRFGSNAPLSPPETPPFPKTPGYVEDLGKNEVVDRSVDNAKLSEFRKTASPPHFPTPPTTELPPTPPPTPKYTRRLHLLQDNAVTPTNAVPPLNLNPTLASNPHPHITSLLAHKPACSSCASISISPLLFAQISSVFSSHISLTTTNLFHQTQNKIQTQIHPSQIPYIIALVPTSTSTNSSTTRFFIPSTHPFQKYTETTFPTLQKYHTFFSHHHNNGNNNSTQAFKITCSKKCTKHDEGYQIWKFESVSEIKVGWGKRKGVDARKLAEWKRGVRGRRGGYYLR